MAARDDTLWNQRKLDIVFALSCVAMLAAMIWMFAKDYNREFKGVQRRGRDIEVALLNLQKHENVERNAQALAAARTKVEAELRSYGVTLPPDTTDDNFTERAKKAAQTVTNSEIQPLEAELRELRLKIELLDKHIAAENAVRDSMISEQQGFLQKHGDTASPVELAKMEAAIQAKVRYLAEKRKQLEALQAERTDKEQQVARLKRPLLAAIEAYDLEARTRDRLARTAASKKIDGWAKIRAWPILDAFNSPYKIQEHVPDGLTINYNFKEVNRVDRCATCHMFIDRPTPTGSKHGFSKDSLRALDDYVGMLIKEVSLLGGNIGDARESALEAELTAILRDKKKTDAEIEAHKQKLRDMAVSKPLTPSEIAVYAHHPRLDLFVASSSAHPVEKFGCTICHSGQGGAAEFKFAYHSPDGGKTDGAEFESYLEKRQRWEKQRGWVPDLHPDNLWDHPMLPSRFIESSCLKCHHQVTDLIRTDGKEEAPKLLKGYRLVRDLGCFGCHEIGGWKSGRTIGPDMRLEPYPAFDDLPEHQRAKVLAAIDPTDPPGDLRKIGPGLRRLADKSHEEFVRRWIRSPRDFRPDTKMPHSWGLENNTRGRLSDAHGGPSEVPDDQQHFPDAEIEAAAFYLLKASEHYLANLDEIKQIKAEDWNQEVLLLQKLRDLEENRKKAPSAIPTRPHDGLPADADAKTLADALLKAPADAGPKPDQLTKDQLTLVLSYLGDRERLRNAAERVKDRTPPPEVFKDGKFIESKHEPNTKHPGQKLFEQKGCVACHRHEELDPNKYNPHTKENLADADFGPNLTNMRDKLPADEEAARKWLFFWLTEPKDHYARTRMPNPNLTPEERVHIANWLLTTGKIDGDLAPTKAWRENHRKVDAGDDTVMKALAHVYLSKALSLTQAELAVTKGLAPETVKPMRADADERILAENPGEHDPWKDLKAGERVKYYVGKKTITRYGCYGCHDIPGFETAKPIGTPLNDWGRKEADRLDFGNIRDYLRHVHGVQPGKPNGDNYDPFFQYALERLRREGFLYQKLKEPRSYDYAKIKDRPWDDRLRMPQFKFAHSLRKRGEITAAYQARLAREEQENLEAVMTFILGLVAENVPSKFVSQPKGDRLNEVKGTKLLEKHNCIGCHVVKPGTYEVAADYRRTRTAKPFAEKLREDVFGPGSDMDERTYPPKGRDSPPTLHRAHGGRFPVFPEHTAWRQQRASPPGKLLIRGVPAFTDVDPAKGGLSVQLWEAVALRRLATDGREQGDVYHAPVGISTPRQVLPPGSLQSFHHPTGGMRFLEFFGRTTVWPEGGKGTDNDLLFASGPPPLIREGQKVQPQWLLEFLLHPHEIRPLVYTRLRMPNFHLSETEAATLRDYFIAVDRLNNPALGLEYSMVTPPQHSPEYQAEKRAEYLRKYKGLIPAEGEPEKADYFEAGWRAITTTRSYCGQCHNIPGVHEIKVVTEGTSLGPALERVSSRLRPEYLERWLSAPPRLVPYTAMTPVIWSMYWDKDPPIQPDPDDKGTKRNQPLQMFLVMPPDERTRAIRDVLLSWGRLSEPNKTPTYKEVKPPGPSPHHGH